MEQPQTIEKSLPNSLEAERSVLGAMLLETDALDAMIEQLHPEDFYLAAHGAIFQAMRDTRMAGNAVDLITLNNALERSGKLEAAGGIVYLTELMNFVPTAANVSYYA